MIKRVCFLAALASAPFVANQIWPARTHVKLSLPATTVGSPVSSADAAQAPLPINYSVDRHHIRIHVNADRTAVVERVVDITPQDETGVRMVAQQLEVYSTSLHHLDILEAWTQRPDGEQIDVLPDAIQDVDMHTGLEGVYSDQKKRVVLFPNVEPGSHLHFKSRLNAHTSVFPGQFLFETYLAPDVVYRDFTVELTHDEGVQVHFETRGFADDSQTRPDGTVTMHRYRFHRDSPQPYETTAVSAADFSPYLIVTTIDSIETLGGLYAERAEAAELPTPEIGALANAITAGIDDPLEQARALYEWVSREIRYVGVYLGDATVVPNRASDVYRNRYGDCKDHNTLLVSLLNAKGIDAQGALINSGDSYSLPSVGGMGTSNHVITYLPQWDLFLDSTNALAPFGVLPDNETDKPAVLVRDRKLARTPRQSPSNSKVKSEVNLRIRDDGVIVGHSHSEAYGSVSLGPRYALTQLYGADRQALIRQMLASNMHPGEGDIAITGLWELQNPLKFDFTFELEPITNFPGEGAFNLPEGLTANAMSSIAVNMSKLKRSTPHFPMPCSSADYEETFRIALDEGTVFTKVPKDVAFEEGGLVYTSHYEHSGKEVVVRRHLQMDLPSNVCQPEEVLRVFRLVDVLKRDLRSQIFYKTI